MKFNNPPWHPMSDPVDLKHIGKLGEETAELSKIVARIIIQGLHGVDPGTGEVNKDNLEKEIADVYANICLCRHRFGLEIDMDRVNRKILMLQQWHKDA